MVEDNDGYIYIYIYIYIYAHWKSQLYHKFLFKKKKKVELRHIFGKFQKTDENIKSL